MIKSLKKNILITIVIIIVTVTYHQFFSCKECLKTPEQKYDELFAGKGKQSIADHFVFPVGPPHARGYYNAQGFGKSNAGFGGNLHLGEDWNGIKGGNSDLGDPVYSIANGYIRFVGDGGPGWGTVIRVIHKMADGSPYKYVESLYGHVINTAVQQGDFIRIGEHIADIGNVNGRYFAHLHFELRYDISLPIGGGYSNSTRGFLHPTDFIKQHLRR